MKSLDDDGVAEQIKRLLEQLLTWSLHKGIIYIKTPLFHGVVNEYQCEKPKELKWNAT